MKTTRFFCCIIFLGAVNFEHGVGVKISSGEARSGASEPTLLGSLKAGKAVQLESLTGKLVEKGVKEMAKNLKDGKAESWESIKKALNGKPESHKELRYVTTPGVAKAYQTLDWYKPSKDSGRGAIVYVHGGGWRNGDKENHMDDKVRYFRDELGYSFVSVNYRLIAEGCSKYNGRFKRKKVPCEFPDNAYDVAAAIAYVLKNARSYGATTKSVSLIGHSAGAHLAALVSTDETYLKRFGAELSNINFVAPLDTDAFNIITREGDERTILNAFGSNRLVWLNASPINYIKRDATPPHLLVYRGQDKRKENVAAYESKLDKMGCFVRTVTADRYSHTQINTAIGKEGEKIITPKILSMLKRFNWHQPINDNICECKKKWSTTVSPGTYYHGCATTPGWNRKWCETKGKCKMQIEWKGMSWKWCE